MPKKRNRSSSAGSSSPKRGWSHVKSGGSAFRDHSVPVNTRSRKLNNKTY